MKRPATEFPRKIKGNYERVVVNIPAELFQRMDALTPGWGERMKFMIEALRREVERREEEQARAELRSMANK
jgi:metal-responsive CopG/Arc/MetJ family transcriptional regulator